MIGIRNYKLIEVFCAPADTRLRFAPCDKSFSEDEIVTLRLLDPDGSAAREYGAKLKKTFRLDTALEPEP